MRNPKYHLYMDYGEYREIIDALIAKKNDLMYWICPVQKPSGKKSLPFMLSR